MEKQEQLKTLNRKIALTHVAYLPGATLVGLGLYSLDVGLGNTFHPILDNSNVVYGMIGVGGTIVVWGMLRIMSLLQEKKRLKEGFGDI